MSTRKSFLAAAAALPLVAAVPSPAPSASPSPTPAHPTPKPTAKPPSPAALVVAERMRSFDAKLSDKELEDIARGIDDYWNVGKRLNPKGRALKNWDEPATPFSVPE